MPSALTPLANITLSSNATTVTFSSISQGYEDLLFVISGTFTGTATFGAAGWRVNNDSGSNYNRVRIAGDGSSASSTTASGGNYGLGFNLHSSNSVNIMHFLDYSSTDKHKTVITRTGASAVNTELFLGRWASTSAITSVTFYPPDAFGGTPDFFTAGSTFALYGVSS